MEKIEEFILQQVSKQQLSPRSAKEMLLEVEKNKKEEVAIVGIACRFSNSADQEEYWKNLLEEKECKIDFPKDRLEYIRTISTNEAYTQFLNCKPVSEEELFNTRKSGYLTGIDEFDSKYFNISPNEAKSIDPDQRIMLENVQDALIDAGYTKEKLNNSRTAVFIGKDATNDTLYRFITEEESSSMTGNWPSLIAGRISYLLNLKGPSLLIDSACSSGLASVHLACKSIQEKESDLAIVGGVSLSSFPYFNKFPHSIMESEDDTLRPFDEKANGTLFCEGVATVILKPVSQALKEKNHIYAVVKGSAFNNDGNTNGITAPNASAQEQVLVDAWKNAKVDPASIQYIETHGTGTKIGDPIEIKGLTNAFSNYTNKKQFCGIGSVKGNLGHTVATSGLASLIKVILSLEKQQIPGTLNFNMPNQFLNFSNTPLYVVAKEQKWNKKDNQPRRAGVSSFGFAGTNCHVVLEEAPETASILKDEQVINNKTHIVVFSSKEEKSLLKNIQSHIKKIEKDKELAIEDISYTTTVGRDHFNYRLALVVTSTEQLLKRLKSILQSFPDFELGKSCKYGFHKVIPEGRESIVPGEMYQDDLNKLTISANNVVERTELNGLSSSYLEQVANYYVQGATIKWNHIFKKNSGKIISLPSYSYMKKTFWGTPKSFDKVEQRHKRLHPFVHELTIDSIKEQIYSTEFSYESTWALTDHKIKGVSVLPGTALIEMIREAVSNYYSHSNITMSNVTFNSPIVVPQEATKKIQLILDKEKNIFTICSQYNQEWTIHCEGNFLLNETIKKNYDVNIFYAQDGVVKKNVTYKSNTLKNETFSFGPRWLNFKTIAQKKDSTGEVTQQLAEIKINNQFKSDLRVHYLHAAMLDNAVNLFIDEDEQKVFLPFSYGKIEIFGRMPSHFYSLVIKTEVGPETKKFNVLLIDENNQVFLKASDYVIKKVINADRVIGTESTLNNKFYSIKWKPRELNEMTQRSKDAKKTRIIMFGADQSSKNRAKQFYEENPDNTTLIFIGKHDKNILSDLSLNPESYDNYLELFRKLKEKEISEIIDTTLLENSESDITGSLDSVHYFKLFKAFQQMKMNSNLQYNLLINYGHCVDNSETKLTATSAEITGFFKAIRDEIPKTVFRVYDIDNETATTTVLKDVVAEHESFLIGFRQNQRYLPSIFEESNEKTMITKPIIKDHGKYLITGGLGSLGLTIAEAISKRNQVELYLMSRTDFPLKENWHSIDDAARKKQIEIIERIENSNSIVHIFSGDVSNMSDMEKLSAEIGKVDGVLHCAGNPGDGFVYNKSETDYLNVLLPKKNGLENICHLFLNEKTDFLVTFSSMVAWVGGSGQTDYASANAYMDAYVFNLRKEGYRAFSINWPAWSEVGMAKRFGINESDVLFHSLTNEQAINMLNQVILLERSNMVVGSINTKLIFQAQHVLPIKFSETLINSVNKHSIENEQTQMNRSDEIKVTGQTKTLTTVENRVATAYANVLNLSEVDVFESFNSLGGDSIMATHLLKILDNEFPDIVEISDIFTYGNVKELAHYIEEQLRNQNASTVANDDTDDGNDLVKMMQALSNGSVNVEDTLRKLG